ncbi:uncharacterized protein [Aristolochia californica]|uniref:uncharacterized protein n=1 Tax=Aristolochia californica TaxID=171875 RepID=UPI0035DF4B2E
MVDFPSRNVTITAEDYAAIQKLKSLLESSTPPGPTTANTIASTKELDKGSSSLTASILLQDVLIVPQFPLNLLSISQLTKQSNCSVTFSPSSCTFQDQTTKQVIGGGHEKGGLYYFTLLLVAAISSTTSEAQLWYNRLGHSSISSLRSLVPFLKYFSTFNCEACQLSKHIRSTYSSHLTTTSSASFALIHSDGNVLVHQTSCSYTPQPNVAERKICHLLEVARGLLYSMKVYLHQYLAIKLRILFCFMGILRHGFPTDMTFFEDTSFYSLHEAPPGFTFPPTTLCPLVLFTGDITQTLEAPAIPLPMELSEPPEERRSCTTSHPIAYFMSSHLLSSECVQFLASLSSVSIPQSYEEALKNLG